MNGVTGEMRIKTRNSTGRKYDVICALSLVTVLFLCAYIATGFLYAPISSPLSYNGGDGVSYASTVKQLMEEKWIWRTERVGAPFGTNVFDFPALMLQNTDFLMEKVLSFFIKDVFTLINIQYLLTFCLAGLNAFIVLRLIGLKRLLAFLGGFVFGLAPYIFGRNVEHYCLTACYFVPFSAYLCFLCYTDQDLLSWKSWKTKRSAIRNIILILLCLLIANNGIGYYPFFTCFFLCITLLCSLLKNRSLRSVFPAIKVIILITVFMLIALLPSFYYHFKYGNTGITERFLSDTEVYALKVAQLFIPLASHGVKWIQDIITAYNESMPLVNENRMSYLGIIAGVGFLLSVLELMKFPKREERNSVSERQRREVTEFASKQTESDNNQHFIEGKQSEREEVSFLASRYNIGAVLFMTIGGLISLLTVLIGITFLRGYNRVSIFIMFFSLVTFLFWIQCLFEKIGFFSNHMAARLVLVGGLMAFALWDQTPKIVGDGANLRDNLARAEADKEFIQQIEGELEEGSMIYQLPYHMYPERGPVNQMGDYQLFTGYLFSDTLKWSYGGAKERMSDRWNRRVSWHKPYRQINELREAGFKGIYIDKRAYTKKDYEKLYKSLTLVLGTECLESKDGNLVFFFL